MAGPLDGIVVADMTHIFAGPSCTMYLGDLGADVVKIENLNGDRYRRAGGAGHAPGGDPYNFMGVNRNKRSLSVDMRSAKGMELVLRLIQRADVFINNFRPSTVEAMGMTYEQLSEMNPRLVYCSISGYGDNGPYRDWPGQDLQAQAMAGLVSLTGFRGDDRGSVPAGASVGDAVTGILATLGIVSALYARHETGRGQRVDTSLLAGIMALHPDYMGMALGTGWEVPKAGPGNSLSPPPYGVWTAKDGKEFAISGLASGNPNAWQDFCERIDMPELAQNERFNTPDQRAAYREELRLTLGPAMLKRDRDEWVTELQKGAHWVCPVKSVLEIANDEHLVANGMIAEIDDPLRGPVRQLNTPFKLSDTETSVRYPVPSFAEHSSEIAEWLGYSNSEVTDLIDEGVMKQRVES